MKKEYLSVKISLITAIILIVQYTAAQCTVSFSSNLSSWDTTINPSGNRWGQLFTAACTGNLEYVQLVSASTGTTSAGTLKIYAGNAVSGTPLYMQSYSEITINTIGDPVRVDITGTVAVTSGNEYIFELDIDNLSVLASNIGNNGFLNGTKFGGSLFSEASISENTLGGGRYI